MRGYKIRMLSSYRSPHPCPLPEGEGNSERTPVNWSTNSSAAACSALRLLPPDPFIQTCGSSSRHSTVNCCSWGFPETSRMLYSGSGSPRACRSSCSRVLGSFCWASGDSRERPSSKRDSMVVGRLLAAVQVYCREDCLQRIGEYGGSGMPTAAGFPRAKGEICAKPRLPGDLCQRLPFNQPRPQSA